MIKLFCYTEKEAKETTAIIYMHIISRRNNTRRYIFASHHILMLISMLIK